jgi:uncharacterized protein YbbK (DUF523 family)
VHTEPTDCPKILVSACLLGQPVRYDGQSKSIASSTLKQLSDENLIIAFCPEVAGGLAIPRPAAEIKFGDGFSVLDGHSKVETQQGDVVTEQFLKGAKLALNLCLEHKINTVILTELSPSCGSREIYDGSFSRIKQSGVGVTTALLHRSGIRVFNQFQVAEAIQHAYKYFIQSSH